MRYRTKPEFVEVYQAKKQERISTLQGERVAFVGDYVVTYKDGTKAVFMPDTFFQKFEKVDLWP